MLPFSHPSYPDPLANHISLRSAYKFLPVIGKYIVGSLQRSLPRDLLEKWKFPTQFRAAAKDELFKGDGSRGGPERRELTDEEKHRYQSALLAASMRQSKL